MGLDMNLIGDKYFLIDWDYPKNNPKEDGFSLMSHRLELGYWRKHPDLHGYIVEQFADGKDDCREINLSDEAIERIIKAIEDDELPTTGGFFFGVSQNDQEQKQSTVDIFRKALAWLKDEQSGEWRSINYQASW